MVQFPWQLNNGKRDKKTTDANPPEPDAMDSDDADDSMYAPDVVSSVRGSTITADDVSVAPPSLRGQPVYQTQPPLAYNIPQADARRDREPVVALRASVDVQVLATGRTSINTRITQTSPNGMTSAVQRTHSWASPPTHVSASLSGREREHPKYSSIASTGVTKYSTNNGQTLCVVSVGTICCRNSHMVWI